MHSARHYPRAPITEAIIDLRVIQNPELTVDALRSVHDNDKALYPTAEPLNAAQSLLILGPNTTTSTAHQQHIGFIFRRHDGLQIQQARLDGFSMSQLAPYPHWEEFRDETRRRWTVYQQVAKPVAIARVGVRYINRLDIPQASADYRDYLNTGPKIAPGLPQHLPGYFMQAMLPFEALGSMALVTETILQPANPTTTSIILDIDIFREGLASEVDDALWEFIEKLRDLKNEIFEACITDKARELFQ